MVRRRQSARVRKPANYTTDAYKDLVSDHEVDALSNPQAASSEDEDFEMPETADAAEDEPDEEALDGYLSYAIDSDDDDEEEDEDEDDEDILGLKQGPSTPSAANPEPKSVAPQFNEHGAPLLHRKHTLKGPSKGRRLTKRPVGAKIVIPDPSVRITYRPGFVKSYGKKDRILRVFGANNKSLIKAVKVRDLWLPIPAVPEKRNMLYTPFWEEGQDDIQALGEGKQVFELLEYYTPDNPAPKGKQGAEQYVPKQVEPMRVLVGPAKKQQIITFDRFGVHNLAEIREHQKGFVLNAGGHVVAMDWARNQPNGTQYLAISTLPYFNKPSEMSESHQSAPAFSPRPFRAAIQIWRFPVDKEGLPSTKPSLCLLLCHDWGSAQELKWCPIPQKLEDDRDLGYLAGVYGDGRLRVLKIKLSPVGEDEIDDGCICYKIQEPAFECGLPGEICTTMSWISNHEVVAGCSSGYVAAWDLKQSLDQEVDFIPYVYQPIHQTFIAQITTCYPAYPHYIVTSSMDGYSRLTSLLDPMVENIPNNRSRIAPTAIVWNDLLNVSVGIEEGSWVKTYPLRRFFSATTLAKHLGVVQSLSTSTVHPVVLSAGSEGEAVFSNPTRRVYHNKIKNYQQTWFMLEYAVSTNMWRMTEGFKQEIYESKAKVPAKKGALAHSAIFPMQVCLTATAWNHNLQCGGWASVGSACGLVRIEDVAI